MSGPVLLMDLAAPLARRLSCQLRARGLEVVMAGPAFDDLLDWEVDLLKAPSGAAKERLGRLLAELPAAIADPRSVQAFKTAMGNPLALSPQPVLRRIVELATLELAALERFDRYFHTTRPSALVLGCDNSHAQRATIARARQLGIPSLQIAHGIYGSLRHLSYAANMDRLYADQVAAVGSRARRHMLSLGNETDRIHLTGAMQWDELYEPANRLEAPTARAAMGLEPDRPLLLFTMGYAEGASSFYRAMSERFAELHQAIGRAVQRLPSRYQIALRPHPHEFSRVPAAQREVLKDALGRHLAELCGRSVHLSTGPLARDVRAADAVAAVGSSSLIAVAMILERPALNLPWFPDEDHVFDDRDGVLVVENDDDLGPALGMLAVAGPARDRALEAQQRALPEINEGHDGRASERVAELVARLASSEVESTAISPEEIAVESPATEPEGRRPESHPATDHQVILFDESDVPARRRMEDDRCALTSLDSDPLRGLRSAPILHFYGRPRQAEDLDRVRRARRGTRRIVWSSVSGRTFERRQAQALLDHLSRHGQDDDRRALILDSLGRGSLVLETPQDESAFELIREMVDLADLLVFASDEEARQFLRRHHVSRAEVAICPLGIATERSSVRQDPEGAILVPGTAGDWAVVEALRSLKGRVLLLDDDPDLRERLRTTGVSVESWSSEMAVSLLAVAGDAAVDQRLLQIAADGLPVLADVESPLFDYLGAGLRLLSFTDFCGLRSELAARILECDVDPGRGDPAATADLRDRFSIDRAGRALISAYERLPRVESSLRRRS